MSLQANLLDFAKANQKSEAVILKEKHELKGVEFIPQILTAISIVFKSNLNICIYSGQQKK